MAEILTNIGLRLPDDFTEDEFFEAGQFLARIERGSQWAIGDWYNAIPWGDKERACERAGLNHKTAREYGLVCAAFEISTRVDICSFNHHRALVIQDLTPYQRADLLEKAVENGWTSARLTTERNLLLGRAVKAKALTFDGHIEQVYEALPKTASTKLKKALDKAVHDLRSDFEIEVAKATSARLSAQREKILEAKKEAEKKRETFEALCKNLDGLMTEEEYRLIRGCLHPDRAPEERKEQFGRAFQVFARLEQSVNRSAPDKVRAARGWS